MEQHRKVQLQPLKQGRDAVIPGSGFVQPASLATIIGGIFLV